MWFSGVIGISSKNFRKQFGTQSDRSGGVSAASTAGADVELWGHHGAWSSWESKKCYVERDRAYVLSVTRAILGYGNANVICAPEPDPLIDIRLESGDIVEIIEGDDDVVTEVEGVPDGAFRWS